MFIFLIVTLICVFLFGLICFGLVGLGVYFVKWEFIRLKVSFYFDRIMFGLILFLVTLRVLLFSCYYMRGEV